MKLQKLSSIAGIISAIVAVTTLFVMLGNDEPDSSSFKEAIYTEKAASSNPNEDITNHTKNLEQKPEQILQKQKVPKSSDQLSIALEIAGTIYKSTERDQAYGKIIEDSLLENNTETAIMAAGRIYHSNTRDENYCKIITYCIQNKSYSLASKLSGSIYQSVVRDRIKRTIIDSVSKKNS